MLRAVFWTVAVVCTALLVVSRGREGDRRQLVPDLLTTDDTTTGIDVGPRTGAPLVSVPPPALPPSVLLTAAASNAAPTDRAVTTAAAEALNQAPHTSTTAAAAPRQPGETVTPAWPTTAAAPQPTAPSVETSAGDNCTVPPGVPHGFHLLRARAILSDTSKPETLVDAARAVSLGNAVMNRSAGLGAFSGTQFDFSDVAFVVLSDPPLWDRRLHPLLATWLGPETRTFATLLAFDEAQRDAAAELTARPAVAAALKQSRAEIVYLPEPGNETRVRSPNAAWKNFPVLAMLRSRFPPGPGLRRPRWFAIVDDDTFVLPANVALHLAAAEAASYNGAVDGAERVPLYAGNKVLKCAFCRNKNKQHFFVFGGTGVFFNPAALDRVTEPRVFAACNATYITGAGDERMGACLVRDAAVRVTAIAGGTENFVSAVSEDADLFVNTSAFPFAFHRATRPDHFHAAWALVRLAASGDATRGFVGWRALARFLVRASPEACGSPHSVPCVGDNAAGEETPSPTAGERRCWPLRTTAADWYPAHFDAKRIVLDKYAAEMKAKLAAWQRSTRRRPRPTLPNGRPARP